MRPSLSPARLLPPLFASLVALFSASPAFAGGVGLLGTGGMHGDRVYGYTTDPDTGNVKQNVPELQMNANFGTGLDVTLGDRDNRIVGVFRFWYLQDAAQSPPKTGDVYAVRTSSRDVGMFSGGLQWGIVGDPTRLQLTAVTLIGSGFLTDDFTEFALGEAGIGGTFNPNRHMQVFAEVTGGIRYRKRVYPTANGTAGIRYLFD